MTHNPPLEPLASLSLIQPMTSKTLHNKRIDDGALNARLMSNVRGEEWTSPCR
jgi:hypothetical protein